VAPAQPPKPAWITIGQIRTLSARRIGRRLGAVSAEELAQVIEGLNEVLGA